MPIFARILAVTHFATNDVGGDLISLYAYLHGLSQADAARAVAQAAGIDPPEVGLSSSLPPKSTPPYLGAISTSRIVSPDEATPGTATQGTAPSLYSQTRPTKESAWMPIFPVSSDAGPPPLAHFARGEPQQIYTYRAANGLVNGYVYRFETADGGKETIPLTYCEQVGTGKRKWCWKAFTEPRPLYGLDRLAAHPQLPVLLVEGEKCADAAAALLPSFVVVTWPGGSQAARQADWTPLLGRTIFAWADCDAKRKQPSEAQTALGVELLSLPFLPEHCQPGMKAMLRIRDLVDLDPKTHFHLVDIPASGKKPDGWDIADAVEKGWDAATLESFIRNVRRLESQAQVPNSAKGIEQSRESEASKAKSPASPESDWTFQLLRKKTSSSLALLTCMTS